MRNDGTAQNTSTEYKHDNNVYREETNECRVILFIYLSRIMHNTVRHMLMALPGQSISQFLRVTEMWLHTNTNRQINTK